MFRHTRNAPVLGIDISTSSVKVVEITREGPNYRLEHYAAEPMPPQLVNDKLIMDVEMVGEVVQRAVKRSGTRTKRGVCAIPGAHAIVRNVVLAADLGDDQVYNQIELQIGDFVSAPLDETSFDYEVLGPRPGDPAHRDVLVVATRREYVEKREAVFEIAGLDLVAVDIEPYALDRSITLLRGGASEAERLQTVAVVDCGATSTSFNVIRGDRVIYTRDQNFGGKQLTEEIMRRYNLTYEEAGRLKRHGMGDEHYRNELVIPFVDELARQIQQAYQYARNALSDFTSLGRMLLCGGVAQIDGIASLLQARLDVPVALANPLDVLSVTPGARANLVERDALTLAVSCGLSLWPYE